MSGMPSNAEPRELPQRIGQYRIVRLLGEGGMGAVYVAEQDNPRRQVALKVLRNDFASGEALKRFAYEAQLLARLQHSGIAQIFEAGTFESSRGSQPYFAMELIDGVRLDEYASTHNPALAQRVELLAKICDAVEHAHQRSVIHRDLKPGNILVDTAGQPKILDFGVARATDADLQLTTAHTEVGQILGTLPYMSPEQVSGNPDAVDTRSDVYALGVIAYQLLSGALPYDLGGLPLWEAVNVIRSVEPSRLSSTSRHLRGDLETIVGKALEKDKARRYGSASELAADLRRYVHNEPITARQPSALYQLRKFTARHRALVGGVGAVFAAVLVGLVVSLSLYTQAERARSEASDQQLEAEQAAARANAINEFLLQRMLGAANPFDGSASVRVVDLLDKAALEVATAFADQPDLEAEVRLTLGRCYVGLRRFDAAEPQLVAALAALRELRGDDAPETLRAQAALATVFIGSDRIDEALATCTAVVERMTRILGPEHEDTLRATTELAQAYDRKGQTPHAIELTRRVLAARERTLGPQARDTLRSMLMLAGLLDTAGTEREELQELTKRTLEATLLAFGANDATTIAALCMSARAGYYGGDNSASLDNLNLAVAAARVVFGPTHPETAAIENELAAWFRGHQQPTESERLLRHALASLRATLGPAHQNTLVIASNLTGALLDQEKFEEAETLAREVLEMRRAVLGDHPAVAESLALLGKLNVRRKTHSTALPFLDEALEIYERHGGPVTEHVADVLMHFKTAYLGLGELVLWESTMRRLLAVDLELCKGEANGWVMTERRELAEQWIATGRASEAETMLCPAMEVLEQVYPDDANVRSRFARIYAACFSGQGRFAEAERWLLVALAVAESAAPPEPGQVQRAREALAKLYDDWRRPADAARVRELLAQPVEASAPRAEKR
jgi:tetratricopeptide (TPR) repeat protein